MAWGGYWLGGATRPKWWAHRQESCQIGYYDGSVGRVTVEQLRANAPFGGMNSLSNLYAWTDGTVASGGYNGGPSIAFWEQVRRIAKF